jgi:hypothetical protein
MRYLSNGVIKSSNTPAPSELPTRNQYRENWDGGIIF